MTAGPSASFMRVALEAVEGARVFPVRCCVNVEPQYSMGGSILASNTPLYVVTRHLTDAENCWHGNPTMTCSASRLDDAAATDGVVVSRAVVGRQVQADQRGTQITTQAHLDRQKWMCTDLASGALYGHAIIPT